MTTAHVLSNDTSDCFVTYVALHLMQNNRTKIDFIVLLLLVLVPYHFIPHTMIRPGFYVLSIRLVFS